MKKNNVSHATEKVTASQSDRAYSLIDSGELKPPSFPQARKGVITYNAADKTQDQNILIDVPFYESIQVGDAITVSLTYPDIPNASRTANEYYVSQEDIPINPETGKPTKSPIQIILPFNLIEDGEYSVGYAIRQGTSSTPCPTPSTVTLENSPGSQWVDTSAPSLSSRSGANSVVIYANGMNLAQVNVRFTPQNPGGAAMYRLAKQLPSLMLQDEDTLTLLDYNSSMYAPDFLPCVPTPTPDAPLTAEVVWAFCRKGNQFVTLPSHMDMSEAVEEAPVTASANGLSVVPLYVLCNSPYGPGGDWYAGVKIVPMDAPSNTLFVTSDSGNATSDIVITTRSAPQLSKHFSWQDVVMTGWHQPHTGELKDDGSEYTKPQDTGQRGNYWRQYNFYLQLNGNLRDQYGQPLKIVAMKSNVQKTGGNDSNMFVDYTSYGYRTRAYLWDFDPKNQKSQTKATVQLWDDYKVDIDITAGDVNNAICVTFITHLSLERGSAYDAFPAGGISGVFYDQTGSPYAFTPNHDLLRDFPEHKDIKSLESNGQSVSPNASNKVFRLGTSAPNPAEKRGASQMSMKNGAPSQPGLGFMFPDFNGPDKYGSTNALLGKGNLSSAAYITYVKRFGMSGCLLSGRDHTMLDIRVDSQKLQNVYRMMFSKDMIDFQYLYYTPLPIWDDTAFYYSYFIKVPNQRFDISGYLQGSPGPQNESYNYLTIGTNVAPVRPGPCMWYADDL